MKLIRSLITLAIVVALVYLAATIKLGQRTLFGHVSQIWATDETQELVDGVKETSGPMMDKIKRGVKAGLEEANRPDGESGDGSTSEESASGDHSSDRHDDTSGESE